MNKIDEAVSWLQSSLEGGPMESKQLLHNAYHNGFTKQMLFLAKEKLRVKSVRSNNKSFWFKHSYNRGKNPFAALDLGDYLDGEDALLNDDDMTNLFPNYKKCKWCNQLFQPQFGLKQFCQDDHKKAYIRHETFKQRKKHDEIQEKKEALLNQFLKLFPNMKEILR